MNARFTSSAEAELQEAIAFYEAAENGLGARFLDEVEAVVGRSLTHPRPEPRCLPERGVAEPTALRNGICGRMHRVEVLGHRLSARTDVQLLVDVTYVIVDGVVAEVEGVGDFLV